MIQKTKLSFINLDSLEMTILPKRPPMICLPSHRYLPAAAISIRQSNSLRLKKSSRNWRKSNNKKRNSSNNLKPCRKLTSLQRRNSFRKRNQNCIVLPSMSLIHCRIMSKLLHLHHLSMLKSLS